MTRKRIVLATALCVLAGTCSWGQDSRLRLSDDSATLTVPRIGLQSVPSMSLDSKASMDTIETSTPGVSIVLYEDNTWQYHRDPSSIMAKSIFTDHWSEDYPDAYKMPLDSIPDKISIWVLDTAGKYRCPDQAKVYSPFGYRHRRRHQGVDLPLHTGDPVYAAFSGKVRMSKYYQGYGNLIVIRHENGLETFYAHLSKRLVEVGDWVEAGDKIGLGGSTGRSTGAHLHFETRFDGYAFDPQWLIDFESGELRHRLFVLKKKYLSASSRYVPESEQEEEDITIGDEKDYAVADSIAQAKKAEEEKRAAELAAAKYYKVRSGDSLWTIAKNNGTTVNALLRLNPSITKNTTLKIGRTIRVK